MHRRQVRCRKIGSGDLGTVVDLLAKGFPDRSVAYWERAGSRLASHAARLGIPHLGYMLECEGVAVGVLLLIFSADPAGGRDGVRCNVSSWYVEPEFVSYGPVLINVAGRDKHVTFFNISPATHVRPIIEAQGFRRYGEGRHWSLPALAPFRRGVRVERIDPASAAWQALDGDERSLLDAHAAYGCLVFGVRTPASVLPFAVLPRLTKNVVPGAQLIYCRDLGDLVRYAGPIGRFLLRRGLPVLSVDAEAAIPGLPGFFAADDCPKYFKGPARPRLGDMSNTELVMFGP